MRRGSIALFIAVMTLAFFGCSYARMDYEMRMADIEDVLSYMPFRFDRDVEVEGTSIDAGTETAFSRAWSVTLDVAAYEHRAVGNATFDGVATDFALYAVDEGYEYAVPIDRGFLHRSACDADCYADYCGYAFENVADPTGFGRIPGIASSGEDAFTAVAVLGSDGAGTVVAVTLAKALGIDVTTLPEADVAIAVAFGAAVGTALVEFTYRIEDLAYAVGAVAYTVDVDVTFSYTLLSGFEFPELSGFCPSFGDATVPGSRTTALGATVYGYAPEAEISALRYDLESGSYRLTMVLESGGRPGEIAVKDGDGNVVVSGKMDDADLSSFQIDVAGTYYITIVRGKLNGALRITLSRIDA